MRRKLFSGWFITIITILTFSNRSPAQNCVLTGLNNSIISSSCGQTCRDLNLQIPDLRSSGDYKVVSIPYTPFPYVTPGGTIDTRLYADDTYSNVFSLPFPFCFYDNVYTQAVVSSNGLVTFDPVYAGCPIGGAAYSITNPIAFNGGGGNCSPGHYPRASIMGAFMDLDPRTTAEGANSSPADRKIEWRVEGFAPCRRFVVSYYHIGVFQATACGITTPATFQIVMYESTGLIDVFFENKVCSANGANGSKSILGVQDFTRMLAVAAPSKNAVFWTAANEGYRFVPFGGSSRFVSCELLAMDLSHVAWATTTAPTPGLLDISFPNICSPPPSTSYIVKSIFSACDDPTRQLISMDTVFVNQVGGLNPSADAAPTGCGLPSGTITVNVPGGTPPYTFVLDGGAPVTGASPYVFNNVAQGLHHIVVTDATGGSCTANVDIFVPQVNTLNANLSSTNTSCSGVSNGTITVTPISGLAPYRFGIDGGTLLNGTPPYTFINLAAGPHNITLADASGCVTGPIGIVVASNPELTANAVTQPTSCSGATNGTVTVTPLSGAGPYTYSLDGAPFVPGGVPHIFTNLAAGVHTVVVTDVAGCVSALVPVTVSPGPALTTSVNTTNVLCNGGNTGIITVTQPTIGNAPYQYSLDNVNWQAGNIFTGLPAGTYTVYYRESNGCQGSQPVSIGEPALLTSTVSTTPVVCNGQNNGIINVSSLGGIAPYEYSIDGGVNWQTSPVFNVIAGNYVITIRDANACIITRNITVTEPATLTANSINANASCDGGNDGVITVNAIGGNSGYQYSIDGINFQPSNIFHVAPGPYTVTVKDNLGCLTTFTTTIGLTTNLTMTPQTDPTICEGTSRQLQLTSNATQYVWTPATGLSSTTISNPVANPVTTTQYIVTATLGRCSADDTVMVFVNPAPIPDAGVPGFICYGQTYQLQGSGGTIFNWTPSTYLSSVTVFNPVSDPAQTITYSLSVTDADGCVSLFKDDVTVDVTPPIHVNTFPYDTLAHPGDQFQLLATSAATIYNWTPSTGLSDATVPNPILTVGPIGSDLIYKVTASTAAGCKGDGFVKLRVYLGPDIYMPTAFSPNNDGKNDKLTPFPVSITRINYFRVFNRWGQLLFSTNQLHDGWDGRFGGREQGSGVYVWMVEGVTKDNKVITKRGTALLVR